MNERELLSKLAGSLTAGKIGREVTVIRYFQSPVGGKLLRVHEGRALVIEGFGLVPVAEVEAVLPS